MTTASESIRESRRHSICRSGRKMLYDLKKIILGGLLMKLLSRCFVVLLITGCGEEEKTVNEEICDDMVEEYITLCVSRHVEAHGMTHDHNCVNESFQVRMACEEDYPPSWMQGYE